MTSGATKQELEAVIDGILGDMDAIPVKELPDRLTKYMDQHGYGVVKPEQCDEVRDFITENDFDLELSRDDVVDFLMPKNGSGSADEQPTSSGLDVDNSSSDASTSDDDRRSTVRTRRPGSIKTAFPGEDPFMIPATWSSSSDSNPPPVRRKKISDASSEKYSSRGELGSSTFSRPSVGLGQRRSSSRKVSMRSDEGEHTRHSSWTSSNPQSPLEGAVDYGSFREHLTSPTFRDLDYVEESTLLELPQAIIMEKDKEISELRRLHAQESSQAQSTIAMMEDEVAEMQRRLDEAYDQFLIDKKDLKVLHDRQIHDERAKMEAELEELRRQLEAARTELSRGNQNWSVQQAKLKELSAAVIEKERDVKDLQSKLDHEIELRKEAQTSAERSDAMTKELMKELEVSRDAEHQLKLQKLENQHLQHTIENVNREYEQLQIQLEPGSQNGGHSGPVTLTRNSGVAISKELLSASGEFEPIRERLIETVVTRTIKVSSPSSAGETKTETIQSEALYTDAGTETDEVVVHPIGEHCRSPSLEAQVTKLTDDLEHALKSPPAYTATPSPEGIHAIIDATHPRQTPCSSSLDEEDYDVLVDALGVRCRVIEDELAVRRAHLDKAGKRKHSHSRPHRDKGWKADVPTWALYGFPGLLLGIVLGSHFLVANTAHGGFNPRDYYHFSNMNQLRNFGGEGFTVGLIERTAKGVARSGWVPT